MRGRHFTSYHIGRDESWRSSAGSSFAFRSRFLRSGLDDFAPFGRFGNLPGMENRFAVRRHRLVLVMVVHQGNDPVERLRPGGSGIAEKRRQIVVKLAGHLDFEPSVVERLVTILHLSFELIMNR